MWEVRVCYDLAEIMERLWQQYQLLYMMEYCIGCSCFTQGNGNPGDHAGPAHIIYGKKFPKFSPEHFISAMEDERDAFMGNFLYKYLHEYQI